MKNSTRVTVVGVGNLLLKDEGIGVHVARALQKMELPESVEVIDGGTSPDSLACLEPADKLIIVDAVQASTKPGTIYRFHPDDLSPEADGLISLHGLGLITSLRMMSLVGNKPGEIIIIGVQPREIDWGMELTAELREKVLEIVKVVLTEIGIASPSYAERDKG